MLLWNLAATVSYPDGTWEPIEVVKDRAGFRSKGPIAMLQTPGFIDIMKKLGLPTKDPIPGRRVRTIVFRFSAYLGKAVLTVAGGDHGSTVFGDKALLKGLMDDDDFTSTLPIVIDVAS